MLTATALERKRELLPGAGRYLRRKVPRRNHYLRRILVARPWNRAVRVQDPRRARNLRRGAHAVRWSHYLLTAQAQQHRTGTEGRRRRNWRTWPLWCSVGGRTVRIRALLPLRNKTDEA